MLKKFDNYGDLTCSLAFDLIEALSDNEFIDASFGKSNQSCSAYVEVMLLDEEGDYVDDTPYKIRFSDHADRYGSNVTFRIEDAAQEITDDGEYSHVEVEAEVYDALLSAAVEAANAHVEALS